MSLLMVAAREAGGEVHVVMDDDERVEFILATSGETRPVAVAAGVVAPQIAGGGRRRPTRLLLSLPLRAVVFAVFVMLAAVTATGVLWIAPWASDEAPRQVDDAEPAAATQSSEPAAAAPSPTETASAPAAKQLVRVRARVTTRPESLRFQLTSDRAVVVSVRLTRGDDLASGILRRVRLVADRSTGLALRDLEPGVWRWVVDVTPGSLREPVRGRIRVVKAPVRPDATATPTPTPTPTPQPTTPAPSTATSTPVPTSQPTPQPPPPKPTRSGDGDRGGNGPGNGPIDPGKNDGPIDPND